MGIMYVVKPFHSFKKKSASMALYQAAESQPQYQQF